MTFLSKIDPRAKLMLVFTLSTLGLLVNKIVLMAIIAAITLLIVLLITDGYKSIIKRLKKIIVLGLTIGALQLLFTRQGIELFKLFNLLPITDIGVTRGSMVFLRMLIIILSATVLMTSSSRDLIQAFIQLKIPYEIAFMVSIAIRYLPLFTEELKDCLTAIQLRGVELERVPFNKKLRIYTYLFMPVVTGVLVKARDLSIAMEMRGFRAFPNRSSFKELVFKPVDYGMTLICLAVLAIITFDRFFPFILY